MLQHQKHCNFSPKVLGTGTCTPAEFDYSVIGDSTSPEKLFPYVELEYFSQDLSGLNIADLLLSLLEQQALGVYCGDLQPSNIGVSQDGMNLVFLDYDQAVYLDDTEKNYNLKEYLTNLDRYDGSLSEKKGKWYRRFRWLSNRLHIQPLIDSQGRLDLETTSIYGKQFTTNTKSGVYHTIDGVKIFANGIR